MQLQPLYIVELQPVVANHHHHHHRQELIVLYPAACHCRLLANSLPAVEQLETQQLPVLAQLHVSSATNLMATARILAPSAFPEGASSPDEHMLSQLDEPLLEVVCSLIDLQLFHLQRAALLSATSRRRSAGHPRCPAASAVSDTLAAHGDDL